MDLLWLLIPNKYQHPMYDVYDMYDRCHVKNLAEIFKNRLGLNQGFLPFLWPKCLLSRLWWCESASRPRDLGMAFMKINNIKYKLCKYLLNIKNIIFVLFPLKSTDWVAVTPTPTFDYWRDIMTPLKVITPDFLRQNDSKGWTYNIIEEFGKIFCRFSATRGKLIGGL